MSTADNLSKQFGPRSGPTYVGPDLDPNHLTLWWYFRIYFFWKSWFWKKSEDDKKACKITQHAKSYWMFWWHSQLSKENVFKGWHWPHCSFQKCFVWNNYVSFIPTRRKILLCTYSQIVDFSINSLTHLCRMYFPILINWTSPFPILGLLGGIFHFYSNFKRHFCKQTVENLIRCCVLPHLIWFCTVCRCPTKRMVGLYGLIINFLLNPIKLYSMLQSLLHLKTSIQVFN